MKNSNGLGPAPATRYIYIALFVSVHSLAAGADISPPASYLHNIYTSWPGGL